MTRARQTTRSHQHARHPSPTASAPRRRRRRATKLFVWLLVLLVAAGTLWYATHRDQVRSWRQAVVIAAALADDSTARDAILRFGHEPGAARASTVGGLPATVIAPADYREDEGRPTLVLLVPAGTTARELGSVARMQRALARTGIIAWALRTTVPGEGLGDAATLTTLTKALQAIAADERTRDGELSIAAAGPLASLALVTAATDPLDGDIRAILAVQPIADVQGLVRLAVTGTTRGADGSDDPHPVADSLRMDSGRALVRALRDQLDGGSPVVDALLASAQASADPLGVLERIPPSQAPDEIRSALEVLHARTPAQFDAAWQRLPAQTRASAEARSPLPHAARVDARVLLGVPVDDSRYPSADAQRLAAVLEDARILRSPLLDPSASIDDVSTGELGDMLAVSAWWLQRAGA